MNRPLACMLPLSTALGEMVVPHLVSFLKMLIVRTDEVLSMNSDMARDYVFASTKVFDDMRANPQAFVLFFSQESMAALSSPQVFYDYRPEFDLIC